MYIIKESNSYLKIDDPIFIEKFKKYYLDSPYGKDGLSSLENYPKGLDLENHEIECIGNDFVKIKAGGDWQEMIPFCFQVKKDGTAIITNLYNYMGKSKSKDISDYLKKVKNVK